MFSAKESLREERPCVDLSVGSVAGNWFTILTRCRRAAQRAGWSERRWEAFEMLARGGDYPQLLRTVHLYFEVVGA